MDIINFFEREWMWKVFSHNNDDVEIYYKEIKKWMNEWLNGQRNRKIPLGFT